MFGTRADAVVDFAYIVTVLAPLFAFLSVRLVRQGRQAAHMRVQTALLAICALAVVALEIRIRVAGGAGKLVEGSPHVGSALMNAVAAVHICGAVATYLVWGWLVFLSRRRYRSLLPGAFSRKHKIAVTDCDWGSLLYDALSHRGLSSRFLGVGLQIVNLWGSSPVSK